MSLVEPLQGEEVDLSAADLRAGTPTSAAVAAWLRTGPAVHRLTLDARKASAEVSEALDGFVRGAITLVELDLREGKPGAEAPRLNIAALNGTEEVDAVDLSVGAGKKSTLGNAGIAVVAACIDANTTLRSLNLDGFPLPIDELKGVLKPVESINLADKKLSVASAVVIAACIRDNPALRTLNMRHNAIGPIGTAAMAAALQGSKITCHPAFGGGKDAVSEVGKFDHLARRSTLGAAGMVAVVAGAASGAAAAASPSTAAADDELTA